MVQMCLMWLSPIVVALLECLPDAEIDDAATIGTKVERSIPPYRLHYETIYGAMGGPHK